MDFYSVDENNFWNKFILTVTIYAVTFMQILQIQLYWLDFTEKLLKIIQTKLTSKCFIICEMAV